MIASSDLVHILYTPDLSEGGIAYACRSLAYTYDRMGGSPIDRMRRIVAGVAVELAFRRYLVEQAVPFDVLGATPFTDPDRYDVSLGGHRCDVKSFFISRRAQIRSLRQDLGLLLQAPALVPLDQFAAEGHKPDDLYLFAFLLGLAAASQEDIGKALAAGQPVYLIHPLPGEWAKPPNWIPLEKLVLKSECEMPITVEIGGQDSEREFVTATLELPPRTRVPVEQTFYSLAYVHAARKPEARIGLHSPVHEEVPVSARGGEPYLILPHEWGNIWVYGLDILLTGWLTHEEYHRKGSVLNAGMRTFQYARTRTKNLLVPGIELNPLGILFEKVRDWESKPSL
ncbi:MAG: hypothetical protein ABIF04_00235 [Chloroflexota bacterium]